MTLETLQFIWFTAFVVLVTGYIILDGFDLGVGVLHLFSKKDEERRLMLNSIGPVWDGNEVWLVTAGGALFAGFPPIYATLLSGFYTPIMALLGGLIFRAVAIEFRSKSESLIWRWFWDVAFALASGLIAFVLGVFIGNLIHGVPLNDNGEFAGTLADLLNPYAILVGVMVFALFMMHGAIYLMMKTEGEFHETMRSFVNPSIVFFIVTYAITTVATLIYHPHMVASFKERWAIFLIAIVNIFAIANIPREINMGRDFRAFLSSCGNMVCLMALYGLGTYPTIVRDNTPPYVNDLTIYNASSSELTLKVLLIIALVGLPMVVAYTTSIYWVFRGKVKLDEHSY